MPKPLLPLLLLAAFPLSGCVAGMAAGALSTAIQASQSRDRTSNANLAQPAAKACEAQAAQYGGVHIIDVERRSNSKIIVWGTVDDGRQRRAFECGFGNDGKVTGFKLRPIPAK